MNGSESGEITGTPVVTPAETVPAATVKPNPWASLGERAKYFRLVTGKPLTEEQIKALCAETGIDHIKTGKIDSLINVLVTTRELSAKLVDKVLGADNVVSLEPKIKSFFDEAILGADNVVSLEPEQTKVNL